MVADPFVVPAAAAADDRFHMFFEVLSDNGKDIGHIATSDPLNWASEPMDLALEESNVGSGLSFPYIIQVGGTWYLFPATDDDYVRVYERGTSWSDWMEIHAHNITAGADTVVFEWKGTWYVFVGNANNTETYLYYAESFSDIIGGSLTEHPGSPVHTDAASVRPAGRPLIRDDYIDFFWQDTVRTYGDRARVFRITDLSPSTFTDQELSTSPVIQGTFEDGAWHENRMHHVEHSLAFTGGEDLFFVDSDASSGFWEIGVFTSSETPWSGTRAQLSANQTYSSGAASNIAFDTLLRDYERGFDTSSGSFIVPNTGVYDVAAQARLDQPSAAGRVLFVLRRDGAAMQFTEREVTAGDYPTLTLSTSVRLFEGQELALEFSQYTGSDQSIRSGQRETFIDISLRNSL